VFQWVKEVEERVRKVRRRRNQFPLLHDNARQHTGLRTTEATATMERTVFSHPPYSLDLTPSDFQLFRTLKDAIRGRPSAEDELKHSTREELRRFKKEFYAYSVSKCVDNEGDFVEK
jgi:DNA-binding response OmpR family regulator